MRKKQKDNLKNTPQNTQNDEELFEREFMSTPALIWRALRRHKLGMISLVVLIILYLLAIFADFVSPMNPFNNHIQYRFAPPSTIYRKDLFTGERVGPHTYLYMSERDPITYQSNYVEATHLDIIKARDPETGNLITFELGAYNPTYNATVSDITYTFKNTIMAKTADGEYIELSTNRKYDQTLIPLSYFTKEENLNGPASYEDGLYGVNFSKLLMGEDIVVKEDNRSMAINTYKSDYRYAPKIMNQEIISIDTFATLEEIYVYFDFLPVVLTPSDLQAVNLKNYPIEFFIHSWDYKLLGLFPSNLHLFGVEKPKLPSLSDYFSNDGILYVWGSDQYGRDIFSRIFFASRISLSIGLIGILLTFTIGIFLGGLAGYFGGWVDEVTMRLTEILMSIPSLYLILTLSAVLPTGISPEIRYLLIVVILSFIGWPGMTRVIRGMTMGLKQTEFVQAAIALGYPPRKVIWNHLLPNTYTYVIVSATLSIPGYILGEASLSFLGVGVTEPGASWGLMLSQAQDIQVLTSYPWVLLPGLFIIITVLAFNLFGDAIRDALDPRALGL